MRDLPVIEDPWIGRVIDQRFEVLALLGKGGMGAIYRCLDKQTGDDLAIKIILDELTNEPEVLARFNREIQANTGVEHPNVVKTLGYGLAEDGLPYFAMELLDGRPLDEVLDDDGPLGTTRIAHIGAQIARGLHAIHCAGIVHRDLKPENVVVSGDGHVKIFDFGLSLYTPRGDALVESGTHERLTEMDLRIGTPMYMAPEYIDGGDPDARCDLYALGVILYEACTGRPPFNGAAYQVIHKHSTEIPTPIEQRVPGRHPAWLREVVHRLLEKDPGLRPQTGEALAELLSRPPVPAPDLTTLTPVAPEHAASHPSPPEPTGLRAWLRWLLPLVLFAAVVWHGFGVATNLDAGDLPPGGVVASWAMAAHTAGDGGDPYAMSQLRQTAASQGHRGKLYRPFQPPSWIAGVSWTRALTVRRAWSTWIGLQEVLLLAALVLGWRWLGAAEGAALAALAAAMGAVPLTLGLGTPAMLLLLILVGASAARAEVERGALLGLAGLVSLRAWLFLPWLLVRREWTAVLAAGAVFALGSAAAVPVAGGAATAGFWTDALPDMWMGDFRGLGLRMDVFGNLALPQLWDSLLPGPSGQQLSGAALALTWGAGCALVGALAWAHRSPGDAFAERAGAATWMLAPIALPVLGHESWLPLALPAMALVVVGVGKGRLAPRWAPVLGIALAVLLYPVGPMRVFHDEVLGPNLPWLAPLWRQAKLAALLALGSGTLSLSLGARSG